MSQSGVVTVFHFCATFLLLWLFWNYGWKEWALARLRQQLFGVRDQLFDLAAEPANELDFNSPAYTYSRASLNNAIRFSHSIGFMRLGITMLIFKVARAEGKDFLNYKSPADGAIAEVGNPELRQKLEKIRGRAAVHYVNYLMLTSPAFNMVAAISFVRCVCRLLTRKAATESGDHQLHRYHDHRVRKGSVEEGGRRRSQVGSDPAH